jgi:hypothetical protein
MLREASICLSGTLNKFRIDTFLRIQSVFSLPTRSTQKQLRNARTLCVAPSQVLCLSLDWSNRRVPTRYGLFHVFVVYNRYLVDRRNSVAGSLIVSLSDGNLALLEPDQTGQLATTKTWIAHSHEPWCVAWNYWDTNVIYSGAGVLNSARIGKC